MSADLEPLLTAGTTPADKVATLARVAGLKDVIAEREQTIRYDLESEVRDQAERLGGKFTLRCDAGQALLAGGDPKTAITDREALASWLADEEPALVAWTDRVEVLDHAGLAAALADAEMFTRDALLQVMKVVHKPVFDADVVDTLLASGRYVVGDENVFHTDTGQALPGVEVRRSRVTFQVRPAKKAREAAAAAVRAQLAPLPAGGDA